MSRSPSIDKVGVLALQGAYRRHSEVLTGFGARPLEVRTPAHLADVDALVIPGGESTTISRLLTLSELFDPIAERIAAGMPVLGTCAGLILLASEIVDGRPDQRSFGALDITVRRNAFGRQAESFEVDIEIEIDDTAHGPAFPAVFIRAPVVERAGDDVEVLATLDGRPVLCRQGPVLAAAFHPELSNDARIHEMFLSSIATA